MVGSIDQFEIDKLIHQMKLQKNKGAPKSSKGSKSTKIGKGKISIKPKKSKNDNKFQDDDAAVSRGSYIKLKQPKDSDDREEQNGIGKKKSKTQE